MAADILLYDANFVPVGQDQKQHVEITRDIAERFNKKYGDTLVLPEPLINKEVAVIPGTDGRKMSKSYGNFFTIFEPDKDLRKKVMKIVTDAGYKGWVGIEYEGSKLDEYAGIRATKALLVKVRKKMMEEVPA